MAGARRTNKSGVVATTRGRAKAGVRGTAKVKGRAGSGPKLETKARAIRRQLTIVFKVFTTFQGVDPLHVAYRCSRGPAVHDLLGARAGKSGLPTQYPFPITNTKVAIQTICQCITTGLPRHCTKKHHLKLHPHGGDTDSRCIYGGNNGERPVLCTRGSQGRPASIRDLQAGLH